MQKVLEEPKWNGWMRMGGDDGKGMKNGRRREGFPMNPLLKTLQLLTQSPTQHTSHSHDPISFKHRKDSSTLIEFQRL